jgi:hypothetical protein
MAHFFVALHKISFIIRISMPHDILLARLELHPFASVLYATIHS